VSRSMVGLLAAVGVAMSALAGLVRGDVVLAMITCAGTAAGLAACFALPAQKKQPYVVTFRSPQ
jgi:hypothetical protein